MWNKLNVELARLMTKNIPALESGRGFDILRHELGWYSRASVKEGREKVNKYSKKYLGIKPFKIGEKREGEVNLYQLASELRKK